MGKTSLVQKVMSLVDSDKVKVVYLDIFKCRTEEFLNAFATAVIKATSNQCEARIINISKFLSRIPPKIEIGLDPINNFELRFDTPQSTVGIHEDVRNFGSKDIIGASNLGLYHDHENNQYQHETQIS